MAVVKIGDVIVPQIFNNYVLTRTTEKSALVRSGIIVPNPELDTLANKGGRLITMPHWNPIGGRSQVLSDQNPLNVNKMTAGNDVARLHARGNAWGANELAGALAGDDPLKAIADQVSDFWTQDQQAMLIATLKGVFGSASMTDLVHNVSAETGAAANFSTKGFLNAQFKLGDAYNTLTAIAVHSTTFQYMNELDLITTERDSNGNLFSTYRGLEVIVDDGMPVDTQTETFTTYLFGKGAIGYGDGVDLTETETDRDSLAGEDILINRRSFVLHPRGIKWVEPNTLADGVSPNDSELGTGTNWTRVYDKKKIAIVAYKHKIG